MSKKILFLSFYFEPDLCAGSFRNSPLAHELARQAKHRSIEIDVVSTLPNRYRTFSADAKQFQTNENITVRRIAIPVHQSGVKDQIISYRTYYNQVVKATKGINYDLVYASSSRLFTAYLGYRIAKRLNVPLYLDIRDIFVDTIKDVFPNPLIKTGILPVMKWIERQTFGYATHINLISGGFEEYFKEYNANFSYFSNGIDPLFIDAVSSAERLPDAKLTEVKTILYAGNIGEGQGLHKIVPQAAKLLGDRFHFKIIGDGGAKVKLLQAIETEKASNVSLHPPTDRTSLLNEYNAADFFFIHLNDYDAFKKVLPSKVFELGVYNKPLIAGVGGYARHFIETNLPGSILFQPCNAPELSEKLLQYSVAGTARTEFIKNFQRSNINQEMAASILAYV